MEKYNNYKDSVDTVALGELIAQCDERNSDNALDLDAVRGISIEKKLIFTKADMNGVSLTPYKILKPNDFCYVSVTSRNGGKISLALNSDEDTYIVSSSYIVFTIIDTKKLLPEYLFLLLSRSEFDRYSRFNSWGSARETFDWDEMCRVKIPLPSIETQRELVTLYKGLKTLAEQNEAMLKPLSDACQAFIVDCKKKYQMVKLGEYIVEDTKVNSEGKDYPFCGINIQKDFMPTNANTEGLNPNKYLVVDKNKFVFSGMQTGRDICIRIALFSKDDPVLVSPAYTTFIVRDKELLLPEFIMIYFRRSEMDRLGWFKSDSSVRSNLDWERFKEIEIPLPPIEVQQSIVSLYTCYEECKRIAKESREQLKNICPALVQKAGECATI